MPTTGVLLMAHGTPDALDEMPEYLRLVRGGRPASAELVAEMRDHYQAIGGRSPLTDITLQQAAALAVRLGGRAVVDVGMRNWRPFIADAVQRLHAAGVTRIVAIPLAPQFSTVSVAKYLDAARAALRPGMDLHAGPSYHDHPLLLEAFAARIREAAPRPDETVIFTAHSLPARAIEAGDSYARDVSATAHGVAARCGIHRVVIAYQSAGRTAEPWLGPDLGVVIAEHAAGGARHFLVVPIGFVCDHTEILFDIDLQAAGVARQAGAVLRRTESLNSSPRFVSLLESLVTSHL